MVDRGGHRPLQQILGRCVAPRQCTAAIRGFTVIELMVVLAIVLLLVIIGVPSFNNLIASQRVQLVAMDIFTSLLRARSEAIKQNTDVTVSSAGTWSNGWTVNVGVENIDTHAATPNVAISNPGLVTYRSSGRILGTAQPKFQVSATHTTNQRCVKVSLSGEPVVTTGACP